METFSKFHVSNSHLIWGYGYISLFDGILNFITQLFVCIKPMPVAAFMSTDIFELARSVRKH
jgi:hypothetical protein